MKNTFLVVCSLILSSAAVQAGVSTPTLGPTSPADVEAIRQARNIQTQALADEDVDLVASFWTDDLTIRRALGYIIASKEEAVAVIQPTGDPATRVIFQRKSTLIQVSDNWPLAYEDGSWTGHLGGVEAGHRQRSLWSAIGQARWQVVDSLRGVCRLELQGHWLRLPGLAVGSDQKLGGR